MTRRKGTPFTTIEHFARVWNKFVALERAADYSELLPKGVKLRLSKPVSLDQKRVSENRMMFSEEDVFYEIAEVRKGSLHIVSISDGSFLYDWFGGDYRNPPTIEKLAATALRYGFVETLNEDSARYRSYEDFFDNVLSYSGIHEHAFSWQARSHLGTERYKYHLSRVRLFREKVLSTSLWRDTE